jgi:hypothetical protein
MTFPQHGTLQATLQKIRGNVLMEKDIISLATVTVIIVGLCIITYAPNSVSIKLEFKSFKVEINTKKNR